MKKIQFLPFLLLFLVLAPFASQAQSANFSGMYSESYQNGESEHYSRAITLDLDSQPHSGTYILAKADGTEGTQLPLIDIDYQAANAVIRFKLDGDQLEGEFMQGTDNKVILMIYKDGETWSLTR